MMRPRFFAAIEGVMTRTRSVPAAIMGVVIFAVLTGCGPMPEPAPTTTPATTPPAEEESAATPGPPATGELTLGELADRVDTAWSSVRSYRITFTGSRVVMPAGLGTPVTMPLATPGATPVARPRETFVSVREVVLPDLQRQEVTGFGADDHEAIAVGEDLFIRGPLIAQIAPGTPPDRWIAIDALTLPDGAVLSQRLGGLPEIPAAPLASVPERLSPQVVREMGTVRQDGRECRVYGAADTAPATGTRIDYTIAVDDRDIPCFIESSVGGVTQGVNEYSDIDGSFTIEPPPAATPVSVPPALATPLARD